MLADRAGSEALVVARSSVAGGRSRKCTCEEQPREVLGTCMVRHEYGSGP